MNTFFVILQNMKNKKVSVYKIFFIIAIINTLYIKTIYGQELYTIKIIPDKNTCATIKTFTTKTSNSKTKFLNDYLYSIFDEGYLQAYYDTIYENNDETIAHLICGTLTPFILDAKHIDTEILDISNVKSEFPSCKNKVFQFKKLDNFLKTLYTYFENNGYPFASIQLDSMSFKNDTLFATVLCKTNQLVIIDSILTNGNISIQPKVLYSLLKIKPNSIYSEKKLQNIKNLNSIIPFINETKPTEVKFFNEKANVYVYLDKKKSNTFDGIIGFIPDYNNENKLFITGDIALVLVNSFQTAEQISFNWKQFDKASQNLQLQLTFPTIIILPLGTNYNFSMLKKDSSYINVNQKISLQYYLNPKQKTSIYLNHYSSSLINSKQFENTNKLPNISDIKTKSIGIQFEQNNLNNIYTPTKGFNSKLDISIGQRNILKNPKIPNELYENTKLTTAQYKIETNVSVFIPLFTKSTLMVKNLSGTIYSLNLFENELYRIGGINTLRGFDEHFFLPSTFSIQTLEFRQILETQSWISFFTDFGYIEQFANSHKNINRVFSLGIGITLNTNIGFFSLQYAYGRTHLSPFDYKNGKIHFGYIALF